MKNAAYDEYIRARIEENEAMYDTEELKEYRRRYQRLLENADIEAELLEEVKDLFLNISAAEMLLTYRLGFHDGMALGEEIRTMRFGNKMSRRELLLL